jgi:hypothetical protein
MRSSSAVWALVEQGSGKRASLSCAKGSPPIARPERSLNSAGGPERATCGRPLTAGSPRVRNCRPERGKNVARRTHLSRSASMTNSPTRMTASWAIRPAGGAGMKVSNGSTSAVRKWPRERPRCGANPAFMTVGGSCRVGWIPVLRSNRHQPRGRADSGRSQDRSRAATFDRKGPSGGAGSQPMLPIGSLPEAS